MCSGMNDQRNMADCCRREPGISTTWFKQSPFGSVGPFAQTDLYEYRMCSHAKRHCANNKSHSSDGTKKKLVFARTRASPSADRTCDLPARSRASAGCKCCSVSLLKKFSRRSPCTLNTTFGCNGNASNAAVWVARGCRGTFACNEEKVACGFPGQLHGSIEWCPCTRRRIVPTKLEACAIRTPSCNAFRGTDWVQRWTTCNTPGNTASRSSPRTVVVAVRFSESLQTICWLASLPVYRIYLINKGSPLPPNASGVLGRLVREVRMANIARESYSYLDAMRALRARLCDSRGLTNHLHASATRQNTQGCQLGWRGGRAQQRCRALLLLLRRRSSIQLRPARIGWPHAR